MNTFYSVLGNTIYLDIEVVNHSGAYLDLTGSDLSFFATSTDGSVIISKIEGDGVSVTDDEGLVTVKLDAEDTSNLTRPTNLYWDLVMINPLDEVYTVARGRLALSLPVI